MRMPTANANGTPADRPLDRWLHRGLGAGVLSIVILVAAIALGWGENTTVMAYDDVLAPALAAIGGIAALLASRHANVTSRNGWRLLAWALFSWGAGGVVWTWLEIVRHVDPFPSMADAGYLGALALFVVGMWRFGERTTLSRVCAALDGYVFAMCMLIIGWQVGLEGTFSESSASMFTKVLGGAYPVGDLMAMAIAIHVLVGAPRHARRSLTWVAAGVGLFGLSDTLFSYLTTTGSYSGAQFIDAGWLIGCLFIGAGALRARHDPIVVSDERSDGGLRFLVVRSAAPIAAVCAAAPEFILHGHVDMVVFLAGITMIIAVSVRQALAVRDNNALTSRLSSTVAELSTILSSSPSGVAYFDRDLRIVRMNAMLARLAGLAGTTADATGRHVAELFPDLWHDLRRSFDHVLAGDGPVANAEFTPPGGADGRIYLASFYPVEVEDAIIGVGMQVVDVTEHHEAEEARQAARATEARFHALVRNSNDLIAVADADAHLLYANPAAERALGLSSAYDAGRALFDRVHPDDLGDVLAAYAASLTSTGPGNLGEFRFLNSDGEFRYLEAISNNLLSDPDIAGVVINAHDVTDRHRAAAELAHQALHDPLTGLPNRTLLIDRLDHALARGRREASTVGVLYVDLDHFKRINDALGHASGDEVLVATAARLRDSIRATDTVARIGGDEFVIVVERAGELEITLLANRLTEAVNNVRVGPGGSIPVTASVGFVVGRPEDSAEALVSGADVAMYRAKQQGRARTERFDERLRSEVAARLELEADLRYAIDHDQLTLYYQPVVALVDGAIVGAEALVRWNHPERGVVPPSEFIALAEETGLIKRVGALVMRQACQDLKRFPALSKSKHGVAVNISAHQLRHDGCRELIAIIRDEGVDPSRITIEITESALMEELESMSEILDELKAFGLRLAVDDFGTGYSSLGRLRNLPVDVLKIDRSFVEGLGTVAQDGAVAGAIMSLGQSLGLAVFAEGVEAREQAVELLRLGCRFAQGYLYGKATRAEEFSALVASQASALTG
jgi:diguanylate cyclase (GGDEF)-like protein/PAS domain S-box-containing protein